MYATLSLVKGSRLETEEILKNIFKHVGLHLFSA